MDRILTRPGPFIDPDMVIGEDLIAGLESRKVLVM